LTFWNFNNNIENAQEKYCITIQNYNKYIRKFETKLRKKMINKYKSV